MAIIRAWTIRALPSTRTRAILECWSPTARRALAYTAPVAMTSTPSASPSCTPTWSPVVYHRKKPLPGGTVYLIPPRIIRWELRRARPVKKATASISTSSPGYALHGHRYPPGLLPDTMQFQHRSRTGIQDLQHFFYLKPKPVIPEYDTIPRKNPSCWKISSTISMMTASGRRRESDLEVVYELMTEYPDMKIELSSHTDNGVITITTKTFPSAAPISTAAGWSKGISRDRIVAKGLWREPAADRELRAAALNGF